MKINLKFHLSIGLVGCSQEDVFELEAPDDLKGEELHEWCFEAAKEWAHEYIEIYHEVIEDEN